MKLTRNGVNLLDILRCPVCEGEDIKSTNEYLKCAGCGEIFLCKDDIPVVIDSEFSHEIKTGLNDNGAWEDYDHEEKTFKPAKHSRNKKTLYQRLTPAYRVQLAPTYKEFLEKYGVVGNVLELGGGPNSMSHPGVINCDINNYSTVDIIGDARKLPFKNSSFEAVVCNSVLEHIYEVDRVVEECFRILKDGGIIYMCVPQVCGRHHTVDYFRWTLPGLTKVFNRFDLLDKGVVLGPGMFISHLAVALFSSLTPFNFLNKSITFCLEWVLFPLRFIDRLGKGNADHEDYAHTIYIIGEKKA